MRKWKANATSEKEKSVLDVTDFERWRFLFQFSFSLCRVVLFIVENMMEHNYGADNDILLANTRKLFYKWKKKRKIRREIES